MAWTKTLINSNIVDGVREKTYHIKADSATDTLNVGMNVLYATVSSTKHAAVQGLSNLGVDAATPELCTVTTLDPAGGDIVTFANMNFAQALNRFITFVGREAFAPFAAS